MKKILIILFFTLCLAQNSAHAFKVMGDGFSFYTYDTNDIESIDCSIPASSSVWYKNSDFITYEVADLNEDKTSRRYYVPKNREDNSERFLSEWLFLYKNMYRYDPSAKFMPSKIIDSEILPSKNGIIIIMEAIGQTEKGKRSKGIGQFILGDKLYAISLESYSNADYVKKVTENIMNTIYPAQ
jgi:hypothetical protein